MEISIDLNRFLAERKRNFGLANEADAAGNRPRFDCRLMMGGLWHILASDGEDVLDILLGEHPVPLAEGHREILVAAWRQELAEFQSLLEDLESSADALTPAHLSPIKVADSLCQRSRIAHLAMREALDARCYILDSRWQDCGIRYSSIGTLRDAVWQFCDLSDDAPVFPADGLKEGRDFRCVIGYPTE